MSPRIGSEPNKPRPVEYPDSDGEPMADNTVCYDWMVLVTSNLDDLLPSDFVAANLLWYPVEGHPEIRLAPDVFVAFGRPKGPRGSYKQWEEGGQPPDVVFEFWSSRNTFAEFVHKQATYSDRGVREYYVYDPERNDFAAWVRTERGLEPVNAAEGYTSPLLGIRFVPGPVSLTMLRPDGAPFRSPDEVFAQAQAAEEQARAAEEQARAPSSPARGYAPAYGSPRRTSTSMSTPYGSARAGNRAARSAGSTASPSST